MGIELFYQQNELENNRSVFNIKHTALCKQYYRSKDYKHIDTISPRLFMIEHCGIQLKFSPFLNNNRYIDMCS